MPKKKKEKQRDIATDALEAFRPKETVWVHKRSIESVKVLEDVMRLAIALAQCPVFEDDMPSGSYIAPAQYAHLPDDLKRYFDAAPIAIEKVR